MEPAEPRTRERPAGKRPRLGMCATTSGEVLAHLKDAIGEGKDDNERIVFNIGGHRFETTQSTLREYPKDSYVDRFLVARANQSMRDYTRDDDGSYFVDRDPAVFGVILSAARRKSSPRMPVGMDVREWIDELRFWGIPHVDIDNEDVLIKQQDDTERTIRSTMLARARTMYAIFAPYAREGSVVELVLPRSKVSKEFEKEIVNLPEDHAPVGSFEWWNELQNIECRRFIWNMGLKVATTGEIKRFQSARAHKYDLLWRMMGKIIPPKKTMFVVRYNISRKSADEEFDEEELDTEIFGARAPSAGAGRKPTTPTPTQRPAAAPAPKSPVQVAQAASPLTDVPMSGGLGSDDDEGDQ